MVTPLGFDQERPRIPLLVSNAVGALLAVHVSPFTVKPAAILSLSALLKV